MMYNWNKVYSQYISYSNYSPRSRFSFLLSLLFLVCSAFLLLLSSYQNVSAPNVIIGYPQPYLPKKNFVAQGPPN